MSSVGWQRWVSSTDLGTYRCQISFSTPSQSHSKSNKRMSEGGSWGSSNFVLTEKNSADTDAKSRWLLHGPAICTQLPSWGRDTHFGSVQHNAAAMSAGRPCNMALLLALFFVPVYTPCISKCFSFQELYTTCGWRWSENKTCAYFYVFLLSSKIRS